MQTAHMGPVVCHTSVKLHGRVWMISGTVLYSSVNIQIPMYKEPTFGLIDEKWAQAL